MILEKKEKVHIVERRQFAEDLRRHFVGEIVKSESNAIRVKGYVWIFDGLKTQWVRKPEVRERVLYASDRFTINIIPQAVDLNTLKYITVPQKGLVVTDGKEFSLDINEFGLTR